MLCSMAAERLVEQVVEWRFAAPAVGGLRVSRIGEDICCWPCRRRQTYLLAPW